MRTSIRAQITDFFIYPYSLMNILYLYMQTLVADIVFLYLLESNEMFNISDASAIFLIVPSL